MSFELHRLLFPFARSFEIAMRFWKILVFSALLFLKQSRTTVSGTCLYTALLSLMQSIYTKTLSYFVAPKNFVLFYGSVTKNSE